MLSADERQRIEGVFTQPSKKKVEEPRLKIVIFIVVFVVFAIFAGSSTLVEQPNKPESSIYNW